MLPSDPFILCRNGFHFTDVTGAQQRALLVILMAAVPVTAPTVFNFTNATSDQEKSYFVKKKKIPFRGGGEARGLPFGSQKQKRINIPSALNSFLCV